MAKDRVLIRKFGNLIDVSPDGRSSLPAHIGRIIEPKLTYVYVKSVYGEAAFEQGSSLQFEPRRLYRYDTKGKLVCGAGYLNKIRRLLAEHNIEIVVDVKDVLPSRPQRYEERWDLIEDNVQYRARQEECLTIIAANDCGVVAAPTGFGKGAVILMLCLLYPRAKIHIVTPGRDLVSKTVRQLTKYLPNIGQVGFGKKRIERITVFSADSLHASDYDADILIVDEAHELMAPTYGTYLVKYKYSRNFAFTATPTGRADKADIKMESLFGEVIFSMSYQEAVDLHLVVPIEVRWLDLLSPNPADGYVKKIAKKRWGIWRNPYRNKAITDAVKAYMGDQVLILVYTLEHALHLREFLPEFQLCYDQMKESDRKFYIKEGLLKPDEPVMTPQRREDIRLKFESGELKHVIATNVWATGVSFDALPVLVWAAGGASEIKSTQVPGRVCRIHDPSGKNKGILIDCCDQFDKTFESHGNSRCRFYKRHNWAQVYPDGRKSRRKRNQV